VSESQIYEFECVLIALLLGAFFLSWVVRRLKRAQPGLAIGGAVAMAFAVRIFVALGLNQVNVAGQLRGGDEILFVAKAKSLASWDFASTANWHALTHQFHVLFFSLNDRLLDSVPQIMLRAEVIAFAVAGLALLAAAVHELAGPRAARITAWVLALEPTNVFFSGILHKEPFMMLAEGLVAYGGARVWKRGDFRAVILILLGCLLATATRPYVGWFLAAGSAAVLLHASLRRNEASRSFALAAVVIALIGAFFPTVWNASSKKNLSALQASQNANAADTKANLSLERVDYSTRDKIFLNLPQRVLDITTKPYPWQLQNASQQLGLLGTSFLFVGLVLLFHTLARTGGEIMQRAGPLVYPMLFLLVAYALSAGNAGTAFRYRTHLVAFLICLLGVLRAKRRPEEAPEAPAPSLGRLQPVLAGSRTNRLSAPTLASR
jgi:hypothetical protein